MIQQYNSMTTAKKLPNTFQTNILKEKNTLDL